MGIAGHLIELVKEKYKDCLYIDGMPEKTRAMWLFMLNMAFKNLRVLVVSSFVIRVKKNSLKPRIYRRYGVIDNIP